MKKSIIFLGFLCLSSIGISCTTDDLPIADQEVTQDTGGGDDDGQTPTPPTPPPPPSDTIDP